MMQYKKPTITPPPLISPSHTHPHTHTHTHTHNHNHTPSTSLKNIINETRTPLAQYIQKKPNTIDKGMSYLEKLKSMLTNNPKFHTFQIQSDANKLLFHQDNRSYNVNVNNHNNNNRGHRFGRQQNIKQKYTQNYFYTESNTQKTISHEQNNEQAQHNYGTPLKNNENEYKPLRSNKHQKTESAFTTTNMKDKDKSPSSSSYNKNNNNNNNKFRVSQRKILDRSSAMIDQIKSQLAVMKKRVVSTGVNNVGSSWKQLTNVTKNRMKKQTIFYSKFVPIPNIKSIDDQINQQICSKWGKMELMESLGAGANANVRQGICNQQKYAVKIYQKYKLIEPRKKKRVYSQIQILQKLPSHPNIITMFQSFQNKRQIHVIFEHAGENSTTLHKYFRNQILNLQQKQIKIIFEKLVRAVLHLHQYGIAHRDIKPDNILISWNQDQGQDQDQEIMIKLIDFGFAIQDKFDSLHCGTPNFMAPQLLQRNIKQYQCKKVDIWALGVTLFYLCQGRYPFKGFDQKDLYCAIRSGMYQFKKIDNPDIRRAIMGMLQVDPSQRVSIQEIAGQSWLVNI